MLTDARHVSSCPALLLCHMHTLRIGPCTKTAMGHLTYTPCQSPINIGQQLPCLENLLLLGTSDTAGLEGLADKGCMTHWKASMMSYSRNTTVTQVMRIQQLLQAQLTKQLQQTNHQGRLHWLLSVRKTHTLKQSQMTVNCRAQGAYLNGCCYLIV